MLKLEIKKGETLYRDSPLVLFTFHFACPCTESALQLVKLGIVPFLLRTLLHVSFYRRYDHKDRRACPGEFL